MLLAAFDEFWIEFSQKVADNICDQLLGEDWEFKVSLHGWMPWFAALRPGKGRTFVRSMINEGQGHPGTNAKHFHFTKLHN